MALPLYLALTAAEFQKSSSLPEHSAWMACHYSPYGLGLSNCPKKLPENAMLILNDRIPWRGHDISAVVSQLAEIIGEEKCGSVLLDFQHPNVDAISNLIEEILKTLPCPVGVSHLYAENFPCPVFLPPLPLDIPLKDYTAPWLNREIWLEAALDGCMITLTPDGSCCTPIPYPGKDSGHKDSTLHCHYTMETASEKAEFTLFRTRDDLAELLEEAETRGITRGIGLWQELNKLN